MGTSKTARRPTPVIHFTLNPGGYGGELCPLCKKTKLASTTKYPVCHPCQTEYRLTEDLLKLLSGHRILIEQDEINWGKAPYPVLTGTIDDVGWEAHYLEKEEKWSVAVTDPAENPEKLLKIMEVHLVLISSIGEIAAERRKKTKIRRYSFVAVAGITMVTAAYIFKKQAEKEKKAREEAQAVEAKEK